MVKILSQTGISLADAYDVEGSIAGVENLESRDVSLVHEMGSTIFSERFSSFMRLATAAAVSQSSAWEVILNDLPAGALRLIAITVEVTPTARVSLASVALREPVQEREMPIWLWDSAVDGEVSARNSTDGSVGTRIFLRPTTPINPIPYLVAGTGQPQSIPDIAFRGITSAFGAGTVTVRALLHFGFSQIGGISSKGLPIPSW